MIDWQTKPLPAVMIAPNGARKVKADHPAIPISIAETVACATASFAAGAGAIHFHVRDDADQHVLDAGQYREGLAELAVQAPEMHAQITTETVGRYGPADMRQVIRDVRPHGASIGVSEMIPSYQPATSDLRFYEEAFAAGVQIQHICYQPKDVTLLGQLLAQLDPACRANIWCLFVLGHYTGRISHPDLLPPFLSAMRAAEFNADWAICAFATEEHACLQHALAAGGKCRVGFENSLYMADGSIAPDNIARIHEAVSLTTAAR